MKSDYQPLMTERSAREDLFSEIYTLFSRKVYNFAFRMTSDVQLSEDITQETFIQVFTNYDNFRGDSQISTWIFAIEKNICLRHLERKKRNSFRSLEKLIEKVNLAVSDEKYAGPEKQFYINQVKDGCLLGVLRCLSFNQRMAFILVVLFDMNVTEASQIINKSENSTRILVHRARKNIKAFLCNNCSLYDQENHCRCENLISFSLKQGWIDKYNPAINPETIKAEIKSFKNEILLYQAIALKNEGTLLLPKILNLVKDRNYYIFSDKKVK
jgi:RNA polymerase sigma factor (sigma-70 family)